VASGGYKVSSDKWFKTLLGLLEFIEFFEFVELFEFIGLILCFVLRVASYKSLIPQSALHHIGCRAALNLTRFRAQSAIKKPRLPRVTLSPCLAINVFRFRTPHPALPACGQAHSAIEKSPDILVS